MVGEAQATNGPLSSEHWGAPNPAASENSNVADVEVVLAGGLDVMLTSFPVERAWESGTSSTKSATAIVIAIGATLRSSVELILAIVTNRADKS